MKKAPNQFSSSQENDVTCRIIMMYIITSNRMLIADHDEQGHFQRMAAGMPDRDLNPSPSYHNQSNQADKN